MDVRCKSIEQRTRGGHQSEVKEEGPHAPGDTSGGAHPWSAAGESNKKT
ncbi:hypothetical protein J2X15_001215 [Rhodoferax saidenbachensis]|uniref:Uncharacterized protein n=1 Tax=Rhodoferax saidenbachensis TaxID=1484693 RepID=A0ABU1ZK57_9BURK|nr:hypothetical protein [Rhodoferax saidenbachensis]